MRFLSRNAEILRICADKEVLHLGCVGFADLATDQRIALAGKSLHKALTDAARTTGIDYSKNAIEYFRAQGFFDNLIYGNAEMLHEVPLEKTFDVIVAGDIVEHISRPGDMLEGLKRFMRRDSVLVLTTPNAFGAASFLRYAAGRFREGAEHVASYNSQNLRNLLERHGYQLQALDTCYQPSAEEKGGLLFSTGKAILEVCPRFGGTLFARATIRQ